MNYVVTGGAGFIGSHLSEALLSQGHAVTVIDNFSTGRKENVAHLLSAPRFKLVEDSIERCEQLPELFEGAETVFHLAAAVGVDMVVKYPVWTIQTNVHGSERVFDAALKTGSRVLITSTSEVYGRADFVMFNEQDDLRIGAPTCYRWSYAASKALDEFMALAYHKERGLSPVVVRLFNTVGPRQVGTYGMVLPRFVEAARQGRPLQVYGDGTQSRCFCHVHDTIRALMGLAREPAAIGQVFNIGRTEPVTILDLAKHVIEVLDSSSEIVFVPYEKAYEPGFEDMPRRMPDISKVRETIDWHPQKSLQTMIREIDEYFAEHE